MVLLRLFGHPVLERDGSRAPISAPPKAVALLAILAANHARPLSRNWLAQSLWPDVDASDARANLRRHLHLLSKAIGEESFLLTRHTAKWNVDSPVAVDLLRFEFLAPTEPGLAVQEYGGELCTGIEDEVLDAVRLRYLSEYEALLRKVIDAARTAGDDTSLALWLQHAIKHDPLDESFVREVMQLRRRHGDRAGALREYNALAQRLRSELATEPESETLALFREIALENPVEVTPNNLQSAATSFVGRERELAETLSALQTARIVTLCGPGGIGKTRLAVSACFDALPARRDGIWFVELEHARTEAAIWDRLAESMQAGGAGDAKKRALASLRGKNALLVFDTCEHLLDHVPAIVQHIVECAPVTVLCTSRRALHAGGERVIELGPLEIPPLEGQSGESGLRYGAYRLFLERAAMINPTFRVAPRQRRALAEILRRVDGLPLAIELVASRASVLTIEGMLTRLSAAMRTTNRLGSSERAQTIEDAIAWSYDLLQPDQRKLFSWLSMFGGRFTLDDVEHVCAAIASPVENLLELVDASLVAIVPGENAHYRLLETTRTFARARLEEDENAHSAFLAHATYFAEKADSLAQASTAQYDLRVPTIGQELADYVPALERCVTYGWLALGLRILEGIHRYTLRRNFSSGLITLTLALLELAPQDSAPAARLHRLVAFFAPAHGLLPLAREHAETACAFYRETGELPRLADALTALAVISYASGVYDDSERFLLEARELAERAGDENLLFKTLARLGALYLAQRDFTRALALLVPAAAGLRKLDETQQLGYALKNMAIAAFYAGLHEKAIGHAQEALTLSSAVADTGMHAMLLCVQASANRELGNLGEALRLKIQASELFPSVRETAELAECVEDIATTFSRVGEYETAARLLGFSTSVRRRVGTEMNPGLRDYYERTLERLRCELGGRFASVCASGETESVDAVAALVRATADKALQGALTA